jgi:hypothetical protein
MEAKANGEIDLAADVAHIVFETQAMLLTGNFYFVMTNEPTSLKHARIGTDNLLGRLTVTPKSKKRNDLSFRSHPATLRGPNRGPC